VSREEIVMGLAEEIRDAIDAGERWTPDYPALMERTGFRRSWCEKAVGCPYGCGKADQDRMDRLAHVNGSGP
jgi:hypothetical protein